MLYGGIAAVVILGVCFWFFVGRKKGKFHAQGKEMMNKAKGKVSKIEQDFGDSGKTFMSPLFFCHQTPSPINLNHVKIK